MMVRGKLSADEGGRDLRAPLEADSVIARGTVHEAIPTTWSLIRLHRAMSTGKMSVDQREVESPSEGFVTYLTLLKRSALGSSIGASALGVEGPRGHSHAVQPIRVLRLFPS